MFRIWVALSVSLACLAQTPGVPRLVFDSQHFDFGKQALDTLATHRFELRNAGSAPLRITRVIPSCGCTTSILGKDTLAPGESASLEVTFNSRGMRGITHKTLQVLSNDPVEPSQTLDLEAEVLREILPSTEIVWFHDLGPKDRRTAQVKLTSATERPITLSDVELSPAPWLGVATRQEDRDLWVDLELAAASLPPGRQAGTDTIALHVANPRPLVVTLQVHWERRSPVVMRPEQVAWEGAAGQERTTSLVLSHREKKAFRVLAARTTNPLLQVEGVGGKAAQRQVLRVRLLSGIKPGVYREKVYVTLDTPGRPELEIPVAAALN